MMRRLRRSLWIAPLALTGVVVLLLSTALLLLRGSLPRLGGEIELTGLDAAVVVERDALGVPDLRAADRLDAARALGFLHAQDRYFQMDLQRRAAAGELSALFGPAALETDRDVRRHRFRHLARRRLPALPPEDRAVLFAYSEGVNSGLRALRVRPFEYLVLRERPEPWRPEDTLLTLYAMYLDLGLWTAQAEERWAVVRDRLPGPLAEFLLPRTNRWEAPLDGSDGEAVTVPGPESGRPPVGPDVPVGDRAERERDAAGSNNWAVAGARTAHGGALLANDMHLGHGLPNIWYRVRMSWGEHSVVGVSLPGAPTLVAGSNGRVAWGFTNSYGDWCDLVVLEEDSTRYRTPGGWREFDRVREAIEVAGAPADTLWIEGTIWGPVWTTDTLGRRLALRWTAHDAESANLELLRLERARDVDEVTAIAGALGIPQQNLVCADADGRIAWALAGRIPRRFGFDGRLPESWADGTRGWDGYYDPSEQPRRLDPADGLLWTANNRVASGRDLERIGDGGYALGARARQIRDGLRALGAATESDMLALQLDDRALHLAQWRPLFLGVLARGAEPLDGERAAFAHWVGERWDGRAGVGSVSYRLVRSAVLECIELALGPLLAPCVEASPDFGTGWLPHPRETTWVLLTERPAHLLAPGRADWDEVLLEAIDRTMAAALASGEPVEAFTWGAANLVRVEHPMARFLPWLARWLAAPPRSLPGDSLMPRVQRTRSGASERMVVSPGREAEAIYHMPGGQSGHPLSPYFLAGHRDWEEGASTPLLPGAPVHRLTLLPRPDPAN